MQLMLGKVTAKRISGILHPKYQVHGFSVDLTVRKVWSVDPTGQVDFGGGEYVPAGRLEITPQRVRLEDNYLWWDLGRGCYFVECNETLNLPQNEIALIEPESRLLRAGAWHVPLFVRGHVAPVELLLEVNMLQLRVKENARLAQVRVFRMTTVESAGHRTQKARSKQLKSARRKISKRR
jgi:deoxycytidine triphosphate deaminase